MAELVVVTGAAGFLASHIVQQLIVAGYRVRGTARGKKLEQLRQVYSSNPNVEIVEINDVAEGTFPHLFDGASAVIHTASPLANRGDAESMLNSAIEGSLNVLRQAEKAGITKFVVTSSIAAALHDPRMQGFTVKSDYWNPVTREEAIAGAGDMRTYSATKTFAERAIWDWADARPHVDVTTILPPFLYGPFADPGYVSPSPDLNTLSTNAFIYQVLLPRGKYSEPGAYLDVRDAARAHVGTLALASASTTPVQERKRIILASPHAFSWQIVYDIIRANRPGLTTSGRLNAPPAKDGPGQFKVALEPDFELMERVTGLKKGEMKSLEETILDTVNALLNLEDHWRSNGHTIEGVSAQQS